MFNGMKRLKLSSRLLILVTFLMSLLIAANVAALWRYYQFEQELRAISEDQLPLIRITARLTEYLLGQSLRSAEVSQAAQSGIKEKLEIKLTHFTQAGQPVNDVLREGKRIMIQSSQSTSDPQKKNFFQQMKMLLETLEKKYGDYLQQSEVLFEKIEQQAHHAKKATQEEILMPSRLPLNRINAADLNATAEREHSAPEQDAPAGMMAALEKMEAETSGMEEALRSILKVADLLTSSLTQEAQAEQKKTYLTLLVLLLISVSSGLLLSSLIAVKTVYPLTKTNAQLAGNSRDLLALSSKIAGNSIALTSSSEKQIRLLDDTAQAVESMNVLIKNNQHLTQQQEELTWRTNLIFENIHEAVAEIKECHQAVMTVGAQIGPLVKALNDEVTQLNLLAMNATAEVIRAEAPKSIAVFTKELKNVAQMAVEKSRSADEMMMQVMGKMRRGLELSENTQSRSKEIAHVIKQLHDACQEDVAAAKVWNDKLTATMQMINAMNLEVQANVSVVEDYASTSKALKGQAQALVSSVEEIGLLAGKHRDMK